MRNRVNRGPACGDCTTRLSPHIDGAGAPGRRLPHPLRSERTCTAAPSPTRYGYASKAVFLPWCESEGIAELAQLDLRVVDRFTASLLQRRRADGRLISKYSVHTYVQPVRQMLNWAAAVGEEVKAKPQLPTRSKPLRDVLTREELDLLERAAVTERDKLIIRVFGDCGLRLEELTRLTASDIVRSGHQAFLRVLGKRSRVRDVPVTPLLLRRLERHIVARPKERSSDHIFLSLRRSRSGACDPLTPNGVYQVIADAVTRAGLTKRVHPHLLRHSWITEMLRQGMSPIQLVRSFRAARSR